MQTSPTLCSSASVAAVVLVQVVLVQAEAWVQEAALVQEAGKGLEAWVEWVQVVLGREESAEWGQVGRGQAGE